MNNSLTTNSQNDKLFLIFLRESFFTVEKKKISIKEISLIAMMAAVITVCSWLSLPVMTIPVTLQTFAVFLTLLILGGKNGTLSILVYILLGLVGVPVFSGFKAGPTALFGVTGGYIIGFLLTGIIFFLITKFVSEKLVVKIISLVIGLIVCYAFGTAWFIYVYNTGETQIGLISALSMCVFPFIIPDLLKLALATALYKLLDPVLKKTS